MGRQCLHLSREGVDNELDVLCGYSFDRFLDDMVAILIFYTLENVLLELLDELCLLIGQDVLEGLYGSVWSIREGRGELTFWTTRQPYICRDKSKTWFLIWFARIFFCD